LKPDHSTFKNPAWWGSAALIAGLLLAITIISSSFKWEYSLSQMPIIAVVVMMVGAGVIYLFFGWPLFTSGIVKRGLIYAVLCGLVFRAIISMSTPILEDDWYRYLWDGGVTANGLSPYEHSPEEVDEVAPEVPEELVKLGKEAGHALDRVNHPWLKTIYPPVAQAFFALAHYISPWELWSWRLVILIIDCATLMLIIMLLREGGLPLSYSLFYWWNPLLIKELYNSAHMDIILFPFILGAIYLAVRKRPVWASASLALAACVKLWPAILLPLILRPALKKPGKLVSGAVVFGVICFALFIPVYAGGLGEDSGFTAYGKHWEMNDALYMLVLWVTRWTMDLFSMEDGTNGHLVTRGIVFGALLLGVGWTSLREWKSPPVLYNRALFVVAALFLVSPTQFPWYYTWMLPLLALSPRFSLLLLTALLPIYYLRFHFSATDREGIFDNWIVWVEYVPVWFLLVREWYVGRSRRDGWEALS